MNDLPSDCTKSTLGVKGKSMRARILQQMAEVKILLMRYTKAEDLLNESIAIQRDMGIQWDPAWTFHRLGRVARLQGDYEQARQRYIDGLRLSHQYESRQSLAWCLTELAELAALNNQPKRAACLLGAAEVIPELYANLFPHERLELKQISGTIRNSLEEESFKAAYETGRQMSLDEAITLARKELEQ